MSRVIVDTDILTYYFRGDKHVVDHFQNYLKSNKLIEISIITYYEIIGGLMAKDAKKQLLVFEDFISENVVLPLTYNSAKISAELYSILRKNGKIVDDIDLLIAGIAIENELTLIINNENHFNRIPGLNIENWTKPKV
jgi:tRNA(fMet)-specific endonuclease VapC